MTERYMPTGTLLRLPDAASDSARVAVLANGNFVVVWEAHQSGFTDVFAKIFTADGSDVTDALSVATVTEGYQFEPVVTAGADGSFLVIWSDESEVLDTESNYGSDVKGQLFSADGMRIGTETIINSVQERDQWTPSVISLRSGGFAVTWETNISFDQWEIRSRIISEAGEASGAEIIVNGFPGIPDPEGGAPFIYSQERPMTAALISGYLVQWTDYSGYATVGHPIRRVQMFDDLGEKRGATLVLDNGTVGMAGLQSGGFITVGLKNNPEGLSDVVVQVFDALGHSDGSRIVVNTVGANVDLPIKAAGLEGGGFVVSWIETSENSEEGRTLKASVFDKNSDVVNSDLELGSVSQSLDLLSFEGGGFVVVWGEESGSAVAQVVSPRATSFFTEERDSVNFNSLSPSLKEALSDSVRTTGMEALYQSLGGNDFVQLPDEANQVITHDPRSGAEIRWDHEEAFHAGSGNDIIIGGNGADVIDGGIGDDIIDGGDGSDYIIGSDGLDNLVGGAGDDTFDYQINWRSIVAVTQTVDGGTNSSVGADIIYLPGSSGDYVISVTYEGFANGKAPRTIIKSTSESLVTLNTSNVELLTFEKQIDNRVLLPSVLTEMTRLAGEVYGPLPTLEHKAEPLASDKPFARIANDAEARGWHAIGAIELGMPAAQHGLDGLSFAFAGGHYQAIRSVQQLNDDAPEANAMVLSGLVNGLTTVALVFRGTDQWADFADYVDFSTHYSKFEPLLTALDKFIETNKIEQIFVSGHSLGAAMVQEYMQTHTGTKYRGLTIGSPGNDSTVSTFDGRIVNFGHTDDPVFALAPGVSAMASSFHGALAGVAAASMVLGSSNLGKLLMSDIEAKVRVGSDVRLNSEVSDTFATGLAEHEKGLYLDDLRLLMTTARDSSTLFYASPLAQALRADNIYAGPDVQIAVGDGRNAFNDTIRMKAGDDHVIAATGDDTIYWQTLLTEPATKASLSTYHAIDGGIGRDTLALPGKPSQWSWSLNEQGHHLLVNSAKAGAVATLNNVERLVFGFGGAASISSPKQVGAVAALLVEEPFSRMVYLDGRAAVVQRADGAASATIARGTDYFDAGGSSVAITGTGLADIVFLGWGTQSVDAGAGDDLIGVVSYTLGGTPGLLTVAGGAGNDSITGDPEFGRLTAMFSGARVNYLVEGDESGLTITDTRAGQPDGVDSVVHAATFQFSDVTLTLSQLLADTLAGTADADILLGRAGNDSLSGGRGDDILDGGAGDDVIDGGDGFDTASYASATNSVNVDLNITIPQFTGHGRDALTYVENLVGSDFDDLLFGSGEGNVLSGGSGNDRIYGDKLNATTGGADVINGGAGGDQLYGVLGNDTIFGDAGDDFLDGGDDDDALDGGDGADELLGGLGNDRLSGGADRDRLSGGIGNDVLDGGLGGDILLGGAGGDIVYAGGDDDYVNGEEGDDFVDGGTGNDVLVGGDGADQLLGGADRDNLQGGLGNDRLDGGADGDILIGNEGGDIILGGTGDDYVAAGDQDDYVNGEDGADVLLGENGDDQLFGFGGADNLQGGAGRDYLDGGADGDIIYGGAGGDIVLGQDGDDYLAGGDDDDYVHGGIGKDVLLGQAGRDVLLGWDGDDTLQGGDGDDNLQGGIGADRLYGEAGADILYGEAGDDVLVGGTEDDYLIGGIGNDYLVGGTGNDTFVVRGGEGSDTISDFVAGNASGDRIQLSGSWTSFASVMAHATQRGSATIIDLGGGASLTLQNVAYNSLNAGDFYFV